MPSLYAETKNNSGEWKPCLLTDEPTVSMGRIQRVSGFCPMIRHMGSGPDGKPIYWKPVPEDPGAKGLTLNQLHAVLSPDGNLQAAHKGAARGVTGTLTGALCDLGAKPIKAGEVCSLCGRTKCATYAEAMLAARNAKS